MDTCTQLPGVLAAAASMPNLCTVDLTVLLPAAEDAAVSGEDRNNLLAGLISPMFELQQLRCLVLNTDVLGPITAAALGGLKQLSCLHLRHQNHGEDTPGPCWDLDYSPHMVDLRHLSGLTQLVELRVCDLVEAQPPADAAGPFCLPSSLGCLEVRGNPEHWLQHLPGCPQLRELHLHGPNWSKHPADVVEIVSKYTPALQKLTLENNDSTSIVPMPAHALAALTALVRLEANYDLLLASAAGWEALGCLQALTHLAGVVVQGAPPAGWQHTGVVQLDVELQVADPVAAARVLAALPALQQANLLVQELLPGPDLDGAVAGLGGSGDNMCTPGGSSSTTTTSSSSSASTRGGVTCTVASSSSSSSSSTLLKCSPHLKVLSIKCFGGIPAIYAAPLIAAAGSSLLKLTLNGEMEPGATSAPLPDLSACTALTRLDLGWSEEAEEGDLLALLQPLAPCLRALCLSNWRKVSPAAAMVLQQVLPHLEKVVFECCGEMDEEGSSGGSEETQLQGLRQQLRPSLTLDMAS